VFIPFEQTKSLSMKLPVALLSKRALTEWSSLVSVVLISTGRSKEVPRASKALIERSLGSLLSHLGLRSGVGIRGVRGSASTSSLSIVLESSIINTVNLFTGNWGALIASRTTQNPLSPHGRQDSSIGTTSFNANKSSISSSHCSMVSQMVTYYL